MRLRPALLATLLAVPALTAASAPAAPVSQVQVVEKEFTITLSRPRVRAGNVIVQVINFGMDDHDLVLQGNARGSKTHTFALLAPGGRATRELKLAPGRYTLYCAVPGHRARGMVAPLIVTR